MGFGKRVDGKSSRPARKETSSLPWLTWLLGRYRQPQPSTSLVSVADPASSSAHTVSSPSSAPAPRPLVGKDFIRARDALFLNCKKKSGKQKVKAKKVEAKKAESNKDADVDATLPTVSR